MQIMPLSLQKELKNYKFHNNTFNQPLFSNMQITTLPSRYRHIATDSMILKPKLITSLQKFLR